MPAFSEMPLGECFKKLRGDAEYLLGVVTGAGLGQVPVATADEHATDLKLFEERLSAQWSNLTLLCVTHGSVQGFPPKKETLDG